MADALALASTQLSKARFADMQKAFGLVYCPEGVLWNIFLKQVFSPVDQTYEDWLHSLYCSGGIAQHEVAHFVRSLQPDEKNIKAVLDNFQRQITLCQQIQVAARVLPNAAAC